MPFFTVSVRREARGIQEIIAEAGIVYWGGGQRHERELVHLRVAIEKGPSHVVLARALRALAEELELL